MEKISLKPVAKELLFKNDEPDSHFDVLTYEGANSQERNLGSLFLVGHITYDEEDLGYIVSLISSLSRREYYSDDSIREQDAKKSFERTLRKLNEVLDDFFSTKQFNLNIGLLAIAGDNIYISRLGRFKVTLARDNEYIDVLNNIMLFHKSPENETKFSNVVSGKIRANDKIFAFFPARPITLRERMLNNVLVKESQAVFTEKIANLASTVNNFNCCGVHVVIDQVKEIPVSAANYNPTMPVRMRTASASDQPVAVNKSADAETASLEESANKSETPEIKSHYVGGKQVGGPSPANRTVIPSEVSVGRRSNILSSAVDRLISLRKINRFESGKRARTFIILAAVVVLAIVGVVFVVNQAESGPLKLAYDSALANVDRAQRAISQNELREARLILKSTLFDITQYNEKQFSSLREQIINDLKTIDKSVDVEFKEIASAFKEEFASVGVLYLDDTIYVISDVGQLYTADGTLAPKEKFSIEPQYIFGYESKMAIYDGTNSVMLYDPTAGKTSVLKFKNGPSGDEYDSVMSFDANLYGLDGDTIYRYSGAINGTDKRSAWNKSPLADKIVSIAADGNIYGVTTDGYLITYFKGEKIESVRLDGDYSSNIALLAPTKNENIFIYDKTDDVIYTFSKTSGDLMRSYDLSSLGDVADVKYISSSSKFILVTKTNTVWQFTE